MSEIAEQLNLDGDLCAQDSVLGCAMNPVSSGMCWGLATSHGVSALCRARAESDALVL